ncbi:dihydropteroate synthase [Acanthopleuribacter pedis]|uniref:dihydropteroate synthase n=1 Tax=Acanthopleuribacter pedis TaxID=442870 RepID=A0A8J7Q9P1_9BACT|nr:dihydropteroate synthase [Acanthopleuribacter pedis]MBO1320292.1 dihydropteroate synthase [Acanthopleuribacter pedis]
MEWCCGSFRLDLTRGPLLMAIINATPDSFSDGYPDPERACARAERLVAEGADILDVGGESTRPGAEAVPAAEEIARVVPVIERLADRFAVPISVDTQKAAVAEAAVAAGASIVNGVSASLDVASMKGLLQRYDVGYVAMHMRARPAVMQQAVHYDDVVAEVTDSLGKVRDELTEAGVASRRVLYDPGIGFGKKLAHNLALLRAAPSMADALGRPLLMGISRKSWIRDLFHRDMDKSAASLEWRDAVTAMASLLLPFPAVAVHRVHQVEWLKAGLTLREELGETAPVLSE